jgi:hypothetical protein
MAWVPPEAQTHDMWVVASLALTACGGDGDEGSEGGRLRAPPPPAARQLGGPNRPGPTPPLCYFPAASSAACLRRALQDEAIRHPNRLHVGDSHVKPGQKVLVHGRAFAAWEQPELFVNEVREGSGRFAK